MRLPTRSAPVFRGWWMLAAIFLVLSTTSGLGFYNASVILRSATEELGASVTAVSGATTMFFAAGGIVGFSVSRLMDRIDIRWFYGAGALLGAAALSSLRWVSSVPALYAFFAVFGSAFAIAGLGPSTTVVARWFNARRSVALSIASTGLSFGGIAITPLVIRFLDSRTLAEAGPWMGLAWLVGVLPLSAIAIRSWPADVGEVPDGDRAAAEQASVAAVDGVPPGATFAEARRSRFFRFTAGAYAMAFLAQVGALAHLFNLASERRTEAVAATVLSLLALASITGRLIGGVVVTRVRSTTLTFWLILLQGAALTTIALADGDWTLRIGAILFGVSVGNVLMLQPLLLAEAFGVRAYSQIYSFNQLFGTIGVAAGPFVLGALRDAVDYRLAFMVAASANLVGAVLLRAAGTTESAARSWQAT